MSSVQMQNISAWKKLENKSGYPYYLNTKAHIESFDHPALSKLLESFNQFTEMKYVAYRAAFKTYELQKKLQVWNAKVSMGVLARHCLSISESSLTLEPCELEAVLSDVHFACARERNAVIEEDEITTELLLNIFLNMYHPERTSPVRVQAVKVLLLLLSDSSCEDKWSALVETCADHNGCVSARRLAALLEFVARTAVFLGEESLGLQNVQRDVDSCFAKSAGMLGMSTRAVVSWALGDEREAGSVYTRWLLALDRVGCARRETVAIGRACSACGGTLSQVLKFACTKCCDMVVCERCYLYDKDMCTISGHKATHTLQEVSNLESLPKECLSNFIKDFRKLFTCTKYRSNKKKSHSPREPVTEPDSCQTKVDSCQMKVDSGRVSRQTEQHTGKRMLTSTVGRAAGGAGNNPQSLLQDIISQLESQNMALKELATQLKTSMADSGAAPEVTLRHRVDSHWGHIATQINRLKILKENLTTFETGSHGIERLQAFDLFSPIPILQEENQKSDKVQPRVLSLDSGNFSDSSKPSQSQLMVLSGDLLRPVVVHATSDSISTVSMNDISNWYGAGTDTESVVDRQPNPVQTSKVRSDSLCVTEQRYDADVQSVADSNSKMKELNADLDTVLDRLQQILANNFVLDDSQFDNSQLRETACEMEGLLGTLIRGVERRTARGRGRGRAGGSAV